MKVMRTTLSLNDEVDKLLRQYAKSRSIGLGKAASDLVWRGLSTELPIKRNKNGTYVLVVPPGSPKITSERVKELELEH